MRRLPAPSRRPSALQREPELAEAITSVGKVLCWHEWNFSATEEQLARAVQLRPSYAEAHHVRGTALPLVGRLHDAIDSMALALALKLDPLSVHYCERLSRFLLYAEDYAAAIVQGQREEAEAIMTRLDEESRHHYMRSEVLAMGYAAMGDLDHAFDSLARAFHARSAGLIYLHLGPGYKPLRGDSRFADLVGRSG